MKVRLSPLADTQLTHAIHYLASRNPGAASRFAQRIEEALDLLHDHPKAGRPGADGATRELVVAGTPYVIVYELITSDDLGVLAILHGRQRR